MPTDIGHFINGARSSGASGRKAPSYNPATGGQIGLVSLASAAETGPSHHLSRKIRQTNFGYRLHNQHLELGLLKDQEACVDPYPRGPDWMPITPKTGSLFHAE